MSGAASTLPADWQAMADATGKPFADGGAYSSDCYTSWRGCVAVLHARGATVAGAESLLRSKHMRWCRDAWDGRGKATVKHFAAHLDASVESRIMAGIETVPPTHDLGSLLSDAQSAAVRFACSLTAILDAIPDEPRFGAARREVAMQIRAASRAVDLGPMRERLAADGVVTR